MQQSTNPESREAAQAFWGHVLGHLAKSCCRVVQWREGTEYGMLEFTVFFDSLSLQVISQLFKLLSFHLHSLFLQVIFPTVQVVICALLAICYL